MKKNIYSQSEFTPTPRLFGVSSQGERGFTLIELLLYLGLSAVLILAASVFLSMLLQSRVKNQAIGEIEQQGLQVVQIMTQTIRNANTINSPAQGVSAASLSLNTAIPANNPTVFDLSSGVIYITEGVGAPIALTNSRITASNLIFQNLSRPATRGIVRVQFTLTYKNPNNVGEYDVQKTFITSGTLR